MQKVNITFAALHGCVVAVDIVLQTNKKQDFIHRIFGVYTLWDPSTPLPLPPHGTSAAISMATHRSPTTLPTPPPRPNSPPFSPKLTAMISGPTTPVTTATTIGPAAHPHNTPPATSSTMFADGPKDFVPFTSHCAVFAKIIYSPPSGIGNTIFPAFDAILNKAQIKYPNRAEKHRHNKFCAEVDKQLDLIPTAEKAYGHVSSMQPPGSAPSTARFSPNASPRYMPTKEKTTATELSATQSKSRQSRVTTGRSSTTTTLPLNIPKPWLTTKSVVKIKQHVEADPFVWPRPTSIADFRTLLRKGTPRPAPRRDKWEKWLIKSLSDDSLDIVLKLHNYIIMNAHFPGDLKDMWLTMFHKHSLCTDLLDWHGLLLSNFLANSLMSWLNFNLVPYIASKHILSNTQVATQQGVQTRDLMNYLAGIKCWAQRHKVTVFALKHDQMKGFDYLVPQGMYDAVWAYGLPTAIIDLDRAAQTDTRCFIHTPHGVTDPITITGITKQGSSPSPVKSTLTTSLGHHYLNDLMASDPDTLIITSGTVQKANPHLPDNHIQTTVVMAEATDDSYIFARSLPSLRHAALAMECFQFAYGWLTQWAKSMAYALQPTTDQPDEVKFDSITNVKGVNPLTVTVHKVKLIVNELDFLQAKIVKQNISKCCTLLSLQPIKRADAEDLDKRIKAKVHMELGMLFLPNPEILTLPVDLHGLDFPSIARINDSTMIDGLHRDLNHPIPSYQNPACITLADWTCGINSCISLIDSDSLKREFTKQYDHIPYSWVIAQKAMKELSPRLSLKRTNVTGILSGELSLSHAFKTFSNYTLAITAPNGMAINCLRGKGMNQVSDMGEWRLQINSKCTIIVKPQPTSSMGSSTTKQNWDKLSNVLRCLDMNWFSPNQINLILPRDEHCLCVENRIRQLTATSPLAPSLTSPPHAWASDGSMIPAASSIFDPKSVTAALTGPQILGMKIEGHNVFILHSELVGLIVGLIISDPSDADATLKTIVDQHQWLRGMNGRSYYRWILDLVKKNALKIVYTPGHSCKVSIPSHMNFEADHYTSASQRHLRDIPTAPIPTFFMDEFTFNMPDNGWIESSIRNFVDKAQIISASKAISSGHQQQMALHLYDPKPPPEYPYTHAYSTYSAVVQLYTCSGQLPTADLLYSRNKTDDLRCRAGCQAIENQHHIFVDCPTYADWRTKAANDAYQRTKAKLEEKEIPEADGVGLLTAAKPHSLLRLPYTKKIGNSETLARTRLAHHIASDWHTAAIRLAGRIWGDWQRKMAQSTNTRR
ncbi:hypothetical protein B0H17DRAFT_1128486 [Mycena rosella]|uniref:Uncharacterized protein n=1 Tax=Mycena rosella TaxID=1033263 RepID=A0AAD7DW73_MYCRO|nr:hypothetical protein B0H17DRAFT_1128486 [Mycena rosella]